MDFGKILSKAWKIIWKHKIFWLFGFLASLGAASSIFNGAGGSGGVVGARGQSNGDWNGFGFLEPSMQRSLEQFFRGLSDIPAGVLAGVTLGVLAVGLLLSVLFLFLRTLGTAGLVRGTALADETGLEGEPLSFGAIFTALKPSFWKVLLLNVILRVGGVLLWVVLFIPVIILAVATCFVGLLLVIPVGWFIEMMVIYATIAIVNEGLEIFPAIERAWQILTKNLGQALLMFLILGVGAAIVGLIIGLPLTLAPLPAIINLFSTGFQGVTAGVVVSAVLSLVMLPVYLFLRGVLQAYILTAWTLTYRRMAEGISLDPELLSDEVETD